MNIIEWVKTYFGVTLSKVDSVLIEGADTMATMSEHPHWVTHSITVTGEPAEGHRFVSRYTKKVWASARGVSVELEKVFDTQHQAFVHLPNELT